jgi:AcrR family transcriptional regulator
MCSTLQRKSGKTDISVFYPSGLTARVTGYGRKGEHTRQRILAAAAGVFSKYGYERTSVARICAAVGIARGTLYQYFRDKQSLFRALIDEQLEQIRRFTAPIDWQAGDAPEPERALYERLLLIFELIHAHQAVFRLTVREARARNPETEDRVREVQREILSAMAAEFRAGTRAGHFLCPDPEFTAAYLLGGILEIVEWNLFIAEWPLDPEALARKVTDLQLRVLLPDAGGEAVARPPKLGEPR